MQIIVGRESLECVIPADAEAYATAATYPEQMWEQLVAKNNGPTINVQHAHRELQRLIDLAVATASSEAIPLYEIEVVCPQLMSLEGWKSYTNSQDVNFNIHQLHAWFIMRHGVGRQFHIDSAGGSVTISFSLRDAPRYDFWCRFG